MDNAQALALFKQTGALLDGHFILRSGLHSRQFFQCALALQEMPIVEQFGAALAEKLRPLNPRTIVSPAMGGLVIGQEVARQLKCRFIFTEKEEGKLVLRRGFKIAPGERMIVVEDVVTWKTLSPKAGGSAKRWKSFGNMAATLLQSPCWSTARVEN
jgi:orotate phosphoribosyltransferase